jgi:Sec-independent protein translocase protein TatA
LGLPEVGLVLLCKNSIVINGRRDKKGALVKGEPEPIGSAECLRLVREFQGNVDDTHTSADHEAELQELRDKQNSLEQRFAARAEELEREHEEVQQIVTSRVAPQVTQEIIQQPLLTEDKRAKLAALIGITDEEAPK